MSQLTVHRCLLRGRSLVGPDMRLAGSAPPSPGSSPNSSPSSSPSTPHRITSRQGADPPTKRRAKSFDLAGVRPERQAPRFGGFAPPGSAVGTARRLAGREAERPAEPAPRFPVAASACPPVARPSKTPGGPPPQHTASSLRTADLAVASPLKEASSSTSAEPAAPFPSSSSEQAAAEARKTASQVERQPLLQPEPEPQPQPQPGREARGARAPFSPDSVAVDIGRKANEISDDLPSILEEHEGTVRTCQDELAKIMASSRKARLCFQVLYVVCTVIMYLAPAACTATPLFPEGARSYIVCACSVAALGAKVAAQLIHPKRRAARHAFIHEAAKKMTQSPPQPEAFPEEIGRLRKLTVKRHPTS